MTRAEISAELDRTACDWRVPLPEMRDPCSADGVVRAARIDFIRRMHKAGVAGGHVAWALNSGVSTIHGWYRKLQRRERFWWSGEK